MLKKNLHYKSQSTTCTLKPVFITSQKNEVFCPFQVNIKIHFFSKDTLKLENVNYFDKKNNSVLYASSHCPTTAYKFMLQTPS